jgi:hypothetical protein
MPMDVIAPMTGAKATADGVLHRVEGRHGIELARIEGQRGFEVCPMPPACW